MAFPVMSAMQKPPLILFIYHNSQFTHLGELGVMMMMPEMDIYNGLSLLRYSTDRKVITILLCRASIFYFRMKEFLGF